MGVETFSFSLKTKGFTDIIDITSIVEDFVHQSGQTEGSAVVFCPGATGAITTIEYEPGLKKDIRDFLEKYFPYSYDYAHHQTWHDDNGSAHIRAAFIGPSLVVPFQEGKLSLGTWQQIVFIDFDTRPRTRHLLCQILY